MNQVKEVVLQIVAHNCPTGSFFVEFIGFFVFKFVLQSVIHCIFLSYTFCHTIFVYDKLPSGKAHAYVLAVSIFDWCTRFSRC